MAAEGTDEFGDLARHAGVLTAGRQIGAVCFSGGVLLLPRFVGTRALDPFLWAYFAQLLMSSMLNLGLERYTAREIAGAAPPDRARALGAALRGRFVALPLTPIALWAFLRFLHIGLPGPGWVAVTAWTAAIQYQGVLFAAVRAAGRAPVEATIVLTGRVAQTVMLLAAAAGGWSVTALLVVVAAADVAISIAGVVSARDIVGIRRGGGLPYRKLAVYFALETMVFAYLRADLVVVGRLVGSSTGATYGLAYRLVDALVSLATPGLLVLFAFASSQSMRGGDVSETRRRAGALLPQLGVVFAATAIAMVTPLGAVIPRLGGASAALRLLLASVPLTYLIGVEAQVLGAEDRNVALLSVAGGVLVANIALNVVLVGAFGLVGAAVALLVTEVSQVIGITLSVRGAGRFRSIASLAPSLLLLLAGAIALNLGDTGVGIVALVMAVGVAGVRMRPALAPRVVSAVPA